jgi:hypothetical protein
MVLRIPLSLPLMLMIGKGRMKILQTERSGRKSALIEQEQTAKTLRDVRNEKGQGVSEGRTGNPSDHSSICKTKARLTPLPRHQVLPPCNPHL